MSLRSVRPRRRLGFARLASSSAVVLVASSMFMAGPPGVAASSPAVTFFATPATATIVGHWTVTPADRAESSRSSATSSAQTAELPELSPKENPSVQARAAIRAGTASAVSAQAPNGRDDGTPRPTSSFMGQQGSNVTCSYFPHGCNPPDMALAASPSRVLQGVNTEWQLYTTSGATLPGWPVSAQRFFGVPSNTCDAASGGQPFLSDPRAIYDPTTGRFWAAMLQLEGALGVGTGCPLKTVYYVAVSSTWDPAGSWNVYEFDMSLGTTNVADFTQLGLNGNAVFFSANMFNQAGTAYEYAEIFEANKEEMQEGHGNFTADGFFNLAAQGPGGAFLADTVQPALNLDMGRDGWFVDTFDGPDPITGNFCSDIATDACRGLAVWRMSNPTAHDRGGPAPTLTGMYSNTLPFAFPPAADQPGCSQCIDASDLRISGTPVIRNGKLYAAWETALNNGTTVVPGIEWAQVMLRGAALPSLSGYYAFRDHNAAVYPALMPGDGGQLAMVYDLMGPSINPQTRYVFLDRGRAEFDRPGVLIKAGEAPYRPGLCGTSALPVCRWGDYSATSFDGRSRIWFAGQYANSFIDPTAAPVFGRNWGTWIAATRD